VQLLDLHAGLIIGYINPLNAELNPIRHLLALVGARHIVHVSRIRVKYRWGRFWARSRNHRPEVKLNSQDKIDEINAMKESGNTVLLIAYIRIEFFWVH
jgi:hypothetical protein